MSEYSAKTLREKMKAKARTLAKPGNYVKDQEVSSADWSPAEPLEADVKTGCALFHAALIKKAAKLLKWKEDAPLPAPTVQPASLAVKCRLRLALVWPINMKEANEDREGKEHIAKEGWQGLSQRRRLCSFCG